MIQVHPGLFVGDEADALAVLADPSWYVIHACKEPYHRAELGYTGRGAPATHPEFLMAYREGRLILNLVDVDNVAWVRPQIIDAAIEAIETNVAAGRPVLVHCNKGVSRSPSIALLWMVRHTSTFDECMSIDDALFQFRHIYPSYYPARGMADYVRANWSRS